MNTTENSDLPIIIPKSSFLVCLIDNVPLKEICGRYTAQDIGKKTAYVLDKFAFYLQEQHAISLKDYIIKYLNFAWPKCPVKGQDVGYRIDGSGVRLSTFNVGAISRELMPELDAAYRRFVEERKGDGNPMYGRTAWCKGLTKETNEQLRIRSEKQRGTKASEETRQKQREKRKHHPLKARHTTPHSEETREKLRQNTARLWAEGVFNRVSSIHVKMRDFLNSLPLLSPLEEECQVTYFSMDFAFPEKKVAIECQGSYYHVDPRIYPNGPINAIQRRNFGRDKAKRKFCCDQLGWVIIAIWEPEINDGTFKEDLKCKLKELNLLKD